MKIKYLLIVLFGNLCFAQNAPIHFDKLKQTYVLENNENLNSLLVLRSNTSSLTVKLDANQNVLDSLPIQNPEKKFKILLANAFDGNVGQLFWTTEKKNEMVVQAVDYTNRTSSFKALPITLPRQLPLVEFSNGSNYFYATYNYKTQTIQFYKFNNAGTFEVFDVDMSQEKFLTADFKQENFTKAIGSMRRVDLEPNAIFQFIDPSQTTAISSAAYLEKAYVVNNKLVLTLDKNINTTHLLVFDLTNFTLERKSINKPVMSYSYGMRSNSFLLDAHLYQIKVNEEAMILTVNDLDGNVISKLGTTKEDNINFAIGNIKQLNGDFDGYREFEKTGQFIRKFQNLKGGLTVYNYGDNKLVTIGAVSSERKSNLGLTLAFTGGLAGAVIGSMLDAWVFSPSLNNLDAYANRKVVYFNSAFNQQAKPVVTEINDLALDKINDFIQTNDKKSSNYNLSVKNNIYYLGYYVEKEKNYYWKPFTDF